MKPTREDFIKAYPTPVYVVKAWDRMHREGANCFNMKAWERANKRARAEADAAYDALDET